ncbi:RNA-binding protein 34 [Anopheles maculipalpis]|uniref:RNA-binding protein 34 n=1 Tax=Anopheles maculipalpis TaxID=1496333 RepID=UPI0021599403|nr:RNA-binding protein 34 [Anopheles maculipalpis]
MNRQQKLATSHDQSNKNFQPKNSVENYPEDQERSEKSLDEQGVNGKTKEKEYTVFIGNLPPTTKKSDLKAIFQKYGTIQTIRFRSNDGRIILYKTVLKDVPSLNAYVRFSSQEEQTRACEMNGQMVGENRIRVCPQDQKQIGNVKSTVFVGNIHKSTTENDLHEYFGRVGPIEYIRYLALKNIAYVCFEKGVSIKKALKLHQEKLNGRPLRIEPVDTQRTNVKVNKKGHLVPRKKLPTKAKDGAGAQKNQKKAINEFHGEVSEKKKGKKRESKKSGLGSAKARKLLANKLRAAMR